ncbi:MAG: InlB B-repeat-containing protein [Clostridia bacterium]|nr:InlB B-repeat-containing protein [Clostridia bacterium]
MKKRILAMILCVATLLSLDLYIAPLVVDAEDASPAVRITLDGSEISELALPSDEKRVLEAEVEHLTAAAYQWQVLMQGDMSLWVNIYDKIEKTCEVSEVVLREMLDETNAAFVRCVVTDAEGEKHYSSTLGVLITTPKEKEPEPVEPEEGAAEEDAAEQGASVFARRSSSSFRSAGSMARDGEPEYVTVTIKYLDFEAFRASGIESAIYSPYVATIEKGSAFTQTVVSPTFLGFAPFYDPHDTGDVDEIKTDATQVPLNYPNLETSVEIRVFYKPIKVNFAIRYFFQNVGDDLYTENVALYHTGKAETGTIISDAYLLEQAGSIEGFSMMYHIPESVAADGSTVFECYFDRHYYLLRFDMDGGYGVEPIYARYGTTFIVNDPVKHGYVFQGWDLLTADTNADGVLDKGDGVADKLPNTIPNEPRFYKAIWSTVNTTYTVVYWAENPDDTNFSYWGYAKHYATSATYVSGSDSAAADGMPDAEHFEYRDALSDKDVFVEGDGTSVVNVYYTRKFYTITFKNTSNSCKIPTGHTHSEAEGCYDYICEAAIHTHDASCLVCTTPAHTHNAGCCSIPYHEHDNKCCSIEPHTHSVAEGCYDSCNGCTGAGHAHVLSCYTTQKPSAPTGTALECANKIKKPENGYVYRYRANNYTYYNFFRCGGQWYQLENSYDRWNPQTSYGITYRVSTNPDNNSSTRSEATAPLISHTHTDACLSCTQPLHEHGNGTCVWKDPEALHTHNEGTCNTVLCPYGGAEHVHEDACYSCSFGAHEHTDACKRLICPIPENHTHGSNCAIFHIRAKYEQTLKDEWPITDYGGVSYDSGQRWDPDGSPYFTEVLVFIATMPDDDFTLTLDTNNNGTKYMYYYLEILPPEGREPVLGEDYDIERDGIKYKSYLHNPDGSVKSVKANYHHITEDEDFFNIVGFEKNGSNPTISSYEQNNTATNWQFFYKRSTEGKLQFSSSGVVSDHPASGQIKYGEKLKPYAYNYVPSYPDNLEPNAYYFAGWYTSPGCFDGTEADWETLTMPADGILLYAKWAPTTHKVNFFTTLDEMNAFENNPTSATPYKTFNAIEHGNIVGSVANPERSGDGGIGLVFGGWFYIDAGQKRAFEPLAMPINRDINVFADWSSFSPQPYRIDYVLMDNPDVAVADPSTGFAYAGSTRTFQAKAGAPYNQLFEAYNEGYFPTIASHSITLQYEEDKEHPAHNVHTFYYVQASNIEYTVRYVNKVTGEEMASKTETTSQAVITERFRSYPNMVPDAFYKRLVISVEYDEETGKYVGTEDNEIIFYYMPNDTSAYYAVHFMQEKLHDPSLTAAEIAARQADYKIDGTGGYEATATHLEGTGTIGDIESIIPQSFPGFELITDHAVTVTGPGGAPVSAPYKTDHFELTVTAEGTELYIFYRRMEFNYKVHYYKYNTTEPVDPVTAPSETTHRGFYNATVSADAKTIGGYTCVSATHQEILIRPDETQNVIVFYYAPVQYVVEYILVPDDGGWLSNTIEVKTGAEDFEGSIPNVNEFYDFGGWFIDAACTISATSKATYDSTTHKLVPIKSALSETESNKFYAKLIPRSGNLTIKRTDAADETQVFVYEIRNNATGDVIEVTVVGNGSVTVHNLLFGEYTVTQQNGWSWRYGDLASAVTHSDTGGTTVQFVGPPVRDQWLSDNSDLILNRKGDTA